ncbi:hypothetical protein BCY86_00255 [Pajaroellobacter abortibovis]|uniref:Uncharacterized protein n=1 Tax=Pajaroellobacter abortibovis TaxID=1882918 RepID=A0A1L6MUT2_9BACT|nr:hypothetical protein BCY86_00255 [Pajaroellobacter abortibovis]
MQNTFIRSLIDRGGTFVEERWGVHSPLLCRAIGCFGGYKLGIICLFLVEIHIWLRRVDRKDNVG